MKFRSSFGKITASVAFCAAIAGCSSKEGEEVGDGDADEKSTVEITSWWSGPGEAEALSALLDTHEKRYEGVNIFNSSENDGTASELTIEQRLEAGEPPDAFQENLSDIPAILDAFPGSLEPLDQLFEDKGWTDVFIPEILDAITIDGSIYAMPVGLHRENAVFINEAVFSENKLSPPSSVEELLSVCEKFAAEDITCLATGGQGWIVRIMFLDLVMGTMGGAEFEQFFLGKGDPDDAKFAEAIDHFRTVIDNYIDPQLWITKDCVDFNGDPLDKCLNPEAGWEMASQALYDGDAAMFMHGDWVGGFIQQLGWEAGIDYSVIGAPGAADTFLFGVDTFAIPAEGKNKAGALEFCETIGSLEGQAAFNNLKGSTPVRLDADTSLLTPVGKQALEDLSNATVVAPSFTFTDMDLMILDYANGAITKDELIAAFKAGLYD